MLCSGALPAGWRIPPVLQPFLDAYHYRSLADAYQAVYAHPDTPRIQPELAGSEAFEENLDLSYALPNWHSSPNNATGAKS
ncbi:MAG: hypothetical protein H6559_33140 [Lewinellaceae bacterium]|nr:hypothetical protein [Lewinellaceae bacterium]